MLCCAQKPTTFLPNVAVRFDYSQVTAAGATQFVSLFYTDRAATTNPTITSNLRQTVGVSPLLAGVACPQSESQAQAMMHATAPPLCLVY